METVYPKECPVPDEKSTDCVPDCWAPGVDCPTGKIALIIMYQYDQMVISFL